MHEMKLAPRFFFRMKEGRKTVELRLFDEKRQKIEVGDGIVFTCADGEGESLVRYALRLHRAKSFAELYEKIPLSAIGYTEEESASASPLDMRAFYSAADEEKYGVLAIELCEDEDVKKYMTDAEAWDYVARQVFKKYDGAFRALAKL